MASGRDSVFLLFAAPANALVLASVTSIISCLKCNEHNGF
jgi:hypothetical protein